MDNIFACSSLVPLQPRAASPLRSSLILPLSSLTAQMARVHHPSTAATRDLLIFAMRSLAGKGNRKLRCIVRASKINDQKNQTLHKLGQKHSFADPSSRNIVLHYSHCVRMFHLPGKRCEAKLLLVRLPGFIQRVIHCARQTQ